jgi:hypothetical protein
MGSLPDELRRLELERHGTWSVEIDGSQQTAGWSKIREALSLSMSALQELRRRLPGSIFQGTLAEALTLQGELTRAGVKSRVVGRRPVEP